MTIYSLIQKNLNRMLAISLGAAGVVLALYSFISLKNTEAQAIQFISNHVTAIVQAGVNSQNINEIDKEIARFTQTWKETQDLDLRVDIFLTDKLIAHAGQLRPFWFFSSKVEENIKLASGEIMKIQVEIGLERFVILSASLLAIFSIFILAVFRILKRSMQTSIRKVTSPLESRIVWLKTVSENLPVSAQVKNIESRVSGISEIDELSESIGTLLAQISLQEDHIAKINFDRGRVKMAEHVAHSIKGVIATLQLKMNSLKQVSDREKHEIVDVIDSLRDISVNLLRDKDVTAIASPTEKKESTHILPYIRDVVAAKSLQYPKVVIHLNEGSLFSAFTLLEAGTLQTIFANLIDNAAEATHSQGSIKINAIRSGAVLKINVSDNGKGIPSDILPKLMLEGATFGKENGNGLGLFHAKDSLSPVGGTIEITSIEGSGTQVAVSIPLSSPPQGFAECFEIPRDALVVMVDDDQLVHQVMDFKAKNLQGLNPILHFSSPNDFETWMTENGPGELGRRIYLFDFDLKDKINGLDLIEKHGLAFESILVSGVADEPNVKKRATQMGVKWLPKEFLSHIQILNLNGMPEEASIQGTE